MRPFFSLHVLKWFGMSLLSHSRPSARCQPHRAARQMAASFTQRSCRSAALLATLLHPWEGGADGRLICRNTSLHAWDLCSVGQQGSVPACQPLRRHVLLKFRNYQGRGHALLPSPMGSFKQDLLDFMALGRAADTLLLCN